MPQLFEQRNGKVYYGQHQIDMYVFHTWLMDYNTKNHTKIRPSAAGKETLDLFIKEQKAYWTFKPVKVVDGRIVE